MSSEPIPLARPDIGPREEELVAGCCAPAASRWARCWSASSASSPPGWEPTRRWQCRAAPPRSTSACGPWAWSRGDEIVTSPLSFVASANCILYEGARPVFCDIDAETLNIDPEAAAAACAEQTAGVLPVHLFGYPADMDRIEALASERGLGIVEDACEAFGAIDSGGMKVGSRGNIATFAFYANKQIATGEGGMLVSGDSGILRQARSERNQGRGDDMDWLAHDRLGYNYRLSDIAAALGVAQIERRGRAARGPRTGCGHVRRSASQRSRA